jgi:hypothetical protein
VPQVQQGADVRTSARQWHKLPGKVFRGSNFRFRAMGGRYRVVVRGSGVYLFAGGHGHVTFRGSSVNRRADGWYSVDASKFRSLPYPPVQRKIGGR